MHPIFIKIGSFVIYWYGVIIAIGIFIGSILLQKFALKEGYTYKEISEITFWTVVWGILGGRFLHILVHFSYYQHHLLDIIKIRNGGLAIQGAIISSLVFLTIYSKIKKIHLLKTIDLFALVVPLGQAIGRIGCFLNGCCYGKPTDLFIGIKFPLLEQKVHPTELYYSFCYLILFFILLKVHKKKSQDGEILGVYLLFFGIIRYLIDFLRGDMFITSFGLASTQLFGILFFFLGGTLFSLLLFKQKK